MSTKLLQAFPAPHAMHYTVSDSYWRKGVYINGHYYRYARGYHGGSDIHGVTGDPLVACVDGTLRHLNWGSAYGTHQFIIVDRHGNGWFYAHASKDIADRTHVKAGQLVGRVGASGNVSGAHLHFEWHPAPRWSTWAHIADPKPQLEDVRSWMLRHRGQHARKGI